MNRFLPFLLLLGACTDPSEKGTDPLPGSADTAATSRFTPDASRIYTLRNGAMTATFTDFGARLMSWQVGNSAGQAVNIVRGFEKPEDFAGPGDAYYGAIVGRYGNRIAKGRFTLGGQTYTLATNNGANHLHGGTKGFSAHRWTARPEGDTALLFSRRSPDGEEGYPGNLDAEVRYVLKGNGVLRIEYTARTDKATPVNLTNHTYFNLDGPGSTSIGGHRLQLFASRFTPVDTTLIPTGALQPVTGTPFDFRQPHTIGERIEAPHEQIRFGGGYDHNFVLDRKGAGLQRAARVSGAQSGVTMEVWTEEPGIQFYTGNFMAGRYQFNKDVKDIRRSAFCLETQHFPDSPNQPAFPGTILKPGAVYRTATEYRIIK